MLAALTRITALMVIVALVLGILASAASPSAPKYTCPPDQWSTKFVTYDYTSTQGFQGQFDWDAKDCKCQRTVAFGFDSDFDSVVTSTSVIRYADGIRFQVIQSANGVINKCCYTKFSPLPVPSYLCYDSDFYVYNQTYTIGGGLVEIDQWVDATHISGDGISVKTSFAANGLPLQETTVYGRCDSSDCSQMVGEVHTTNYFEQVIGIKDPSIFELPANCTATCQ